MNKTKEIDLLNRLLQILYRSLPQYVEATRHDAVNGTDPVRPLLAGLAANQQAYARQVADAILEEGGPIEPGQFPIEFTATNDLDLRFLLKKAVEAQKRDITAIEKCATGLTPVPPLHALAEEILDNARRHLDMLEKEMSKDE